MEPALPCDHPQESNGPWHEECRLPAVEVNQQADQRRRDDRADAGPRGDDAGRERALVLREPLGHGLQRRREVHGFGDAEQRPQREEADEAAPERVQHRGDAPPDDGQRERPPRAKPVDERPEHQLPERVCHQECVGDPPVLGVRELELVAHDRCRDGKRLAVDVADGGDEAEQDRDTPAHGVQRRHRRLQVSQGRGPRSRS